MYCLWQVNWCLGHGVPVLLYVVSVFFYFCCQHNWLLSCWPVADPQSLLEEREALAEKLALTEYELRLAQEDTRKLKDELLKKSELTMDEFTGNSNTASLPREWAFVHFSMLGKNMFFCLVSKQILLNFLPCKYISIFFWHASVSRNNSNSWRLVFFFSFPFLPFYAIAIHHVFLSAL